MCRPLALVFLLVAGVAVPAHAQQAEPAKSSVKEWKAGIKTFRLQRLCHGEEAGDAETMLAQGEEAYRTGDYDKAIADYTAAIRLKPDYANAYYNRGAVYEKKGDKAKAAEDFAQAKKLGYKKK